MDIDTALEIIGTIFSVLYGILLIRENIWCWGFGILSAVISVYIYFHSTLYAESILAIYYIIIGIYGYMHWHKRAGSPMPIVAWKPIQHIFAIGIGLLLSVGLFYVLKTYTPATHPMADAFVAIFGFIASYKEARKILSGWLYWIVINAVSAGLFYQRSLYFYCALALGFMVLSVWGYRDWGKKYCAGSNS